MRDVSGEPVWAYLPDVNRWECRYPSGTLLGSVDGEVLTHAFHPAGRARLVQMIGLPAEAMTVPPPHGQEATSP